MPELPEVEILVRHLAPLLKGKTIEGLEVHRARLLRPTHEREFRKMLIGATIQSLLRRGKYLVFTLSRAGGSTGIQMLGHLGMTGRMYVKPAGGVLPKHTAVVLSFGGSRFVFEDVRGFGRLTLDATPLARLGPEPLDDSMAMTIFTKALKRSTRPIKVKLLDQSLIAGVGNIYASESLFRAGISPRLPSFRLTTEQARRLLRSLRKVLTEAIESGTRVALDWAGDVEVDGAFYYGRAAGLEEYLEERFQVYDRKDRPCRRCGTRIKRIVQSSRSTFFCPRCQRR